MQKPEKDSCVGCLHTVYFDWCKNSTLKPAQMFDVTLLKHGRSPTWQHLQIIHNTRIMTSLSVTLCIIVAGHDLMALSARRCEIVSSRILVWLKVYIDEKILLLNTMYNVTAKCYYRAIPREWEMRPNTSWYSVSRVITPRICTWPNLSPAAAKTLDISATQNERVVAVYY